MGLRPFASFQKKGTVAAPLFSRGTYQFEVKEGKKIYYPFLQLSDEGAVRDSFCSCAVSEKGDGCPHLAAAYDEVMEKGIPLHVRFARSFWNALCWMLFRHLGEPLKRLGPGKYGAKFVKLEGAGLKKLLEERGPETEETSLKFSGWTAEEMAAYRRGEGSEALRYELSVWSDIAKWMMQLAEEEYSIAFGEGEPPADVDVRMAGLKVWASIGVADWPSLIPSLDTVQSPLKVWNEGEGLVQSIAWTGDVLRIQKRAGKEAVEGAEVGEWRYLPGKGFARQMRDPLLEKEELRGGEIAQLLDRRPTLVKRFLDVEEEPQAAGYHLHFDAERNLHIELYWREVGDLKGAQLFGSWVHAKRFVKFADLPFPALETVVPRAEVAAFVNHHRVWLHNVPGFRTHLRSLESRLIYSVDAEGTLRLEAELSYPESSESLDFGEWVWLPGQGFFAKSEARGRVPLFPGLEVRVQEMPEFLQGHREELEQVEHFWCQQCPVVRRGLSVHLDGEGRIALAPVDELIPDVKPDELRFYGDFVYWKGHGFTEVPPLARLPERYREPLVLPINHEAAFLTFELEPLKPFVLDLDPRLKRPASLRFVLHKVEREKRRRDWTVDGAYLSEFGQVDLVAIWEAFQEKRRFLYSPAGLLVLAEPRFQWIRQLQKRRIDLVHRRLRLSALEWIRLSVYEELPNAPPFLEEVVRPFDMTALQARLRPYQESGLHWLWSLYCHGLSGLLCDDMGLGKTLQAMGLLAAMVAEDPERQNKYLVVCPTSVLYHWQELFKRFFPSLRILGYHGMARTLEAFATDYDVLLTSYGILRAGKEALGDHAFELAIFDEIQIAKNPSSQTHKALGKVQTRMRLGLTGTPIENRLRELKALMDLVLPGYLPPDPIFRDLFALPIEKGQDPEKQQLLGKLIRPFLLRRKKSEVLLDLPEKTEEIAYCDLSEEQADLYRKAVSQIRGNFYGDLRDTSKAISYVHIFSALSTLKRLCDHPALVGGRKDGHSGKWELFLELLYEARDSGQKVVVFSQYLEMLALIETYLQEKGIGYVSLKGSTRDRIEPIRRFREDPTCEVFVGSLLAAGVGIDLTTASVVIHYDRWWNPAKENQATDRVHRMGQSRGVQVFKLVTKDTIEEHIHQLIERKKGLLEQVVGYDDAETLRTLSREDLIEIFDKMNL